MQIYLIQNPKLDDIIFTEGFWGYSETSKSWNDISDRYDEYIKIINRPENIKNFLSISLNRFYDPLPAYLFIETSKRFFSLAKEKNRGTSVYPTFLALSLMLSTDKAQLNYSQELFKCPTSWIPDFL